MKVIVAGSRDITDISIVAQAMLDSNFNITEIVSGSARGVDKIGEFLAIQLGVPCTKFPADWSAGKGAGFTRNIAMAKYADALVEVTNGSRGTAHMIATATKMNLKVHVHYTKQ